MKEGSNYLIAALQLFFVVLNKTRQQPYNPSRILSAVNFSSPLKKTIMTS